MLPSCGVGGQRIIARHPDEKFQSTHPAGGATMPKSTQLFGDDISIHAPRGGSDSDASTRRRMRPYFNPRTPRGVRHSTCISPVPSTISIHAPRGGCDREVRTLSNAGRDFNPRTPRGVRRGAYCRCAVFPFISIHAPRGGCDCCCHRKGQRSINFNPRTPRGVRHKRASALMAYRLISIHAPRGGCDSALPLFVVDYKISIHAPRGGCDCSHYAYICSL